MNVKSRALPERGASADEVLRKMAALRTGDVKWAEGQVFSLVFHAGDELADLLKQAYTMFFSENGLNPTAFPSLRRFETEVVAMTARLRGGAPPSGDGRDPASSGVVGNMTSGGTESILMAVKTARDRGRARGVREPEMLLPSTAHPAFDKAAHYFDVRPVHVPVRRDFRADVAATRRAMTPRTVLVVGSAPSYPHGVVDPIDELARLARERGVLCHVDACVGGFMLPFVRDLGYPVPAFDFSVPGVTSMSVDLHKYGYAAKGASVVLHRDAALRRYQYFAHTEWPGGIYVSPTMTGTRPGGAIAAAWAILNRLGRQGYLDIAREVMTATRRIQEGVAAMEGLRILGEPVMSVMALGGTGLDIYAVGDEMTARGWHLDRQQHPASLHLTVSRGHVGSVERFLSDLAEATARARRPLARRLVDQGKLMAASAAVRALPAPLVSRLTQQAASLLGLGGGLPKRTAAMYGMMATLPNRGDLRELVVDVLDRLTRPVAQD